jgi:hypothetical protein
MGNLQIPSGKASSRLLPMMPSNLEKFKPMLKMTQNLIDDENLLCVLLNVHALRHEKNHKII